MAMSLLPDSIKELPNDYVGICGSVALIAMGVMFFYFIVSGTKANLKSKFISLDPNSGNCIPVMKEISAQAPFYATAEGYWLGESEFDFNRVQYYLTLNKFAATEEIYSEMVRLNYA